MIIHMIVQVGYVNYTPSTSGVDDGPAHVVNSRFAIAGEPAIPTAPLLHSPVATAPYSQRIRDVSNSAPKLLYVGQVCFLTYPTFTRRFRGIFNRSSCIFLRKLEDLLFPYELNCSVNSAAHIAPTTSHQRPLPFLLHGVDCVG